MSEEKVTSSDVAFLLCMVRLPKNCIYEKERLLFDNIKAKVAMWLGVVKIGGNFAVFKDEIEGIDERSFA